MKRLLGIILAVLMTASTLLAADSMTVTPYDFQDKNLRVIKIDWVDSPALTIESQYTGTAVLTNGTAQTPANCNAGSGNDAGVTCWSGTADEAVDITGLTNGREVERLWIVAAADKVFHNFEVDIIIPKNKIFSMWCVGGDTMEI